MRFDYDDKLSDPDYYGGMINIRPKESDPPDITMEGWEKSESNEKCTKQIKGGN